MTREWNKPLPAGEYTAALCGPTDGEYWATWRITGYSDDEIRGGVTAGLAVVYEGSPTFPDHLEDLLAFGEYVEIHAVQNPDERQPELVVLPVVCTFDAEQRSLYATEDLEAAQTREFACRTIFINTNARTRV